MRHRFSLFLVVWAVVCSLAFAAPAADAKTKRSNSGKHLTGGHGSSHKGGHYVKGAASRSSKRHLVGGKGSSHKGGHYSH